MQLLWLAFLLSAASPTLLGRVYDRATGKAIPHAEIRITTAAGRLLTPVVNDRGSFRVDISGRFRLEVAHAGFRTIQSSEVAFPDEGLYQMEIPLNAGDPNSVESVELQVQELQDIENRADPTAREA